MRLGIRTAPALLHDVLAVLELSTSAPVGLVEFSAIVQCCVAKGSRPSTAQADNGLITEVPGARHAAKAVQANGPARQMHGFLRELRGMLKEAPRARRPAGAGESALTDEPTPGVVFWRARLDKLRQMRGGGDVGESHDSLGSGSDSPPSVQSSASTPPTKKGTVRAARGKGKKANGLDLSVRARPCT